MAGEAIPLAVANTSSSGAIGSAGRAQLRGYSLKEAAGTPAAARCNIRDGNGGPILASINFAASGSATQWFDGGIRVNNQLYLQVLAGTVEGVIYVG